jgi:hypothetical protein
LSECADPVNGIGFTSDDGDQCGAIDSGDHFSGGSSTGPRESSNHSAEFLPS